jgi:hypothetical protein
MREGVCEVKERLTLMLVTQVGCPSEMTMRDGRQHLARQPVFLYGRNALDIGML